MTVNPNFAPVRPARPLGTFFRWETPSEGISVHLNLRIIELMDRDSLEAGGKPVVGVLLGRPNRGRDLTIAIEHYETVTFEGETPASPFADAKVTDSILDRWRPGRSRMSILGLYRTTPATSPLNSDDFSALARLLPSAANTAPKNAEYASRPTPIIEDPDQIFLMIGPRTERISKATLYLVRKGQVICESPEVPFDRTELAKIGAAGQPPPREPRPSSTPEPRFSTKDVPNPAAEAKPEPQRQPKAKSRFELPGKDIEIPNWVWPALAPIVLLLLLGGYFWNHGKLQGSAHLVSTTSQAGTTSVLGLKLDRSGSSWKLSWNENAAVVQGAAKGRLLITDGPLHRTLDLEASDLHGGTIIYTPVTDNVVLQLQVDSPDSDVPVSETVRVLGGILPPLETPDTGAGASISAQNGPSTQPYPPASAPSPTASPTASTPSPGRYPAASSPSNSAYATASAPLTPAYPAASAPVTAASQPYPAYATIPPPRSALDLTQTARNFPSSQPGSASTSGGAENSRLTPSSSSSSKPLVASEMPEPYRSLMRRGESMPTAPVATATPRNAAPAATSQAAKTYAPVAHDPTKGYISSASSHSTYGRGNTRAEALSYPAYDAIPAPTSRRANKPAPAASLRAKAEPQITASKPNTAPDLSYLNQPQETIVKLTGDTGNVETAELISRQDPEYPAKAKSKGIAGDVEVHFRIGKDGHVYDVTVVRGQPELSQAAVQAVLKWRYKPALVGGVPADSDANATFSFTQN